MSKQISKSQAPAGKTPGHSASHHPHKPAMTTTRANKSPKRRA